MMMKVTAVIIGAGERGKTYARYATDYPDKFEIVGVAEPRSRSRQYMKTNFNLTPERCYENWSELNKEDKFADCAIICTQDQQHVEPAVAFAKRGYNILLEKPMAVTPEDCILIYKTCIDAGVHLFLCHVLRHHPCVIELKELIDSGVIGDVVNIRHTEPIGFAHFAHSFVRGNWGNTSKSAFSLLTKCVHDIDLISYWMSSQKCTKISSFGSLMHFRKENKPNGAARNCLKCPVEDNCAYSAQKIYLDTEPARPVFPMSVVCDIEDSEKDYMSHLTEALKKGPYGKCVYDTDNDVCDNQVVNFMFENGATASLTMIAFTKEVCQRQVTIYGTKGELRWNDLYNYQIQYYNFLTRTHSTIPCAMDKGIPDTWGHGGSDYYTIKSFVDAVSQNKEDKTSGPKESLCSHLLAFIAEESRLTEKVINVQEHPLITEMADTFEKLSSGVFTSKGAAQPVGVRALKQRFLNLFDQRSVTTNNKPNFRRTFYRHRSDGGD